MRTLSHILFAVLLIGAISARDVRAQQETQQQQAQPAQQQGQQQPQGSSSQPAQDQSAQPIPAYRSPWAVGAESSAEDTDAQKLEPDTRSLAGAQDLSLGAPKTSHDFWSPYFDLSSTLDSTLLSTSGGTGWTTWATVYGGLDLNRTSANSTLQLTYLGGGAISSSSIGNSVVQQLGLSEAVSFRRSEIVFLDQLAYLPEASFGYAGLGGPDLQTGGNLGLQIGFTPDQSILTAFGQRISNSFVSEVNTSLTPRSNLTLVGGYSLLDFFDNNLNDTTQTILQAGYSYQMTRKDTIALIYRFDAFRYNHIAQSINDDAVGVSYARRITGRLAFQATGGPDIVFSQTPISQTSTSSTVTGATPGKTRQFFWDLGTNLTYQLQSTSLQLSYNHSVTGGSGVLAGAITDDVLGTASRQLTRGLRGAWTLGYSRNTGIALTPGVTPITSNQTYDYWFTGVSFNRSLGRSMSVYGSYQVNYQNSNSAFCVTVTCGTSFLQHQITVSLDWRPRPIAF
jgi:hypothetical protein